MGGIRGSYDPNERAYCITLPRLANWMWLQPCGSREPASPKMSLYKSLHLISYWGEGEDESEGRGESGERGAVG
jgi:hypothetical protein